MNLKVAFKKNNFLYMVSAVPALCLPFKTHVMVNWEVANVYRGAHIPVEPKIRLRALRMLCGVGGNGAS